MDQYIPTQPDITSDDKLWAALDYVFWPIVPVILMLMDDKKNRPFIKFHNIQSLVVGAAIFLITSVIGAVTCGIGLILWLVMFYFAYRAYMGETFEIPVITNFIRSQGWV
jgi:uncharacterized membrane protein